MSSTEPETNASPAQLRPRDPADVRWYLPSWGERLRLMGWRNILWLPATVIAAFTLITLPSAHFGFAYFGLWLSWWKLIALVVCVPFTMAITSARTALRDRRDPFCIHCGYSLVGLAEGHACPECGEVTSHALSREYQRDPQWFIERYKASHAMPTADAPFESGIHRTTTRDGT